MLGSPDSGTSVDSVMEGAASSSMPPARSWDSISGSPPSWLLANTVTASRPAERSLASLAASTRRIVKGCVSGVLTPSLNSNSAAALAGLVRIAAAHTTEAEPSSARRVIFFIFVASQTLDCARAAVSAEPGGLASHTAKPGAGPFETILRNPRNLAETVWVYACYLTEGASKTPWEAQMNHSIHSADRATHLKIVVVALVAGIAVVAFGAATRNNVDYSQTARVIKADKPVMVTTSDTMAVR